MEWARAAIAQLFVPILTICIIVVTVEASGAKYLITVQCIRCASLQVAVLKHRIFGSNNGRVKWFRGRAGADRQEDDEPCTCQDLLFSMLRCWTLFVH